MENSKKDEIFSNFKKFLESYGKISETTKETYFNSLKFALKNQEFNNIEEINFSKLYEYLENSNISRNKTSKVKNALKLLYKSNGKYLYHPSKRINQILDNKPKDRINKKEALQLKKTLIKINALRNKKLKLAYRLIVVSGLRNSELADLKKKNLEFTEDNRIKIFVEKGKGNKQRYFKSKQDKYLCQELKKFIENIKNDEQKLFYSAGYMRTKASELGFKSHKLRKLFATDIFLKSHLSKNETLEIIRKLLGHEEGSNVVNRYIDISGEEINTTGTKYDI